MCQGHGQPEAHSVYLWYLCQHKCLVSDMKMENKQKSGITIVTLVITVIILTVLTGAVMLTMVGDNGIFGETQTTVDKYNKQAMIDEIKLKIQKKKLSNIEKGQYAYNYG